MEFIKKLSFILDKRQKKYLIFLSFMLMLGLIFEFLSIGILLPILNITLTGESSTLISALTFLSIENLNSEFLVKIIVLLTFLIYTTKFLFLIFLNTKNYNFLNSISASLSNKLFKKYLFNDFNFHIETNSSYLIKNIITEISSLRTLLESSILLILEFLLFIAIVSFLIFIQPIAALTIFSFFSFSSIVFHLIFNNKIKRWGIQRQNLDNKIIKNLTETFGGISEIKIFKKENFFFKRFEKDIYKKAGIVSKNDIIGQLPRLYLEYITVVSVLGLLIVMTNINLDKEEIITTLGIFAAASFKIIPSINKIIYCSQKIKFNYPSLSIVHDELKNNLKLIVDKVEEKQSQIEFRNIRLENVSFSYPNGKVVLKGINLNFKSKQVFGLVGKTGEGKSTLVNLLSGLIDPISGKIVVNSNETNKSLIDLQILGFVPQTPFLLDATIKDNICFGNSYDERKYREAIDQSQLTVFLNSLENKDQTIVGERGIMLSGGQRQRISIARALYHNSQVIIFDEPTSALDSKTEENLMNSIQSLKRDKTIFIISHSKSILKFCDEVYEVSNKSISKLTI
jgi:ATP-binding cassette, subfamily B, bacterial PglK